jgi:predicted PurR-regulated permease PerM
VYHENFGRIDYTNKGVRYTMNEELLNQLLQKFQDLINNINEGINSNLERIDVINNAIKALQNGDIPDIGDIDLSEASEPLRQFIDNVRSVVQTLRKSQMKKL